MIRAIHLRWILVMVLLFAGSGVWAASDEGTPPTKEQVVAKLPPALQPSFKNGLKLERMVENAGSPADLQQAEKRLDEGIILALKEAREYLQTASAEDKEKITKVLMFFRHLEDDGPPPPPPADGPQDPIKLVDEMIKHQQGPPPPGGKHVCGAQCQPQCQHGQQGPPPPGGQSHSKGGKHQQVFLIQQGGPVPPPCSDVVRNAEQQPQETNVPFDGKQGNLIFRTVCDNAPYDKHAIGLPSGRMAGGFDVESITSGIKTVFGIRVEGGADVYHSTQGNAAFHSLVLEDTSPSSNGKYEVYLDLGQSDPGARVTINFIDAPK